MHNVYMSKIEKQAYIKYIPFDIGVLVLVHLA